MADYYLIVSKAVTALDPNTGKAREELYARARAAMASEIRRAFPPLPAADVIAAKDALERAIEKVEAEALPPNPPPLATSAASRHGSSVAVPEVPTASKEVRGSRKKRWTDLIRRAAGARNAPPPRDTWLAELLERASDRAERDEQEFAPGRARAAADANPAGTVRVTADAGPLGGTRLRAARVLERIKAQHGVS
jgi:hypothetical protein